MATTDVDIINRALQVIGTRTTMTTLEYANQSSNEAIQARIILHQLRKDLLRMAPWNCAKRANNLTYITSVPGTPENTSVGTTLWQRGIPMPPWVYEFQYPADCLRPCYIIPQLYTGFAGDVPITNAVTGSWPTVWNGPAVPYKVSTDLFYPVTAAAVAAGGTGYAVDDIITLAGTPQGDPPIGAPAQLRVLTAPGGVVGTVEVVTVMLDSDIGGSYFAKQTNPVAQGSTTGSGSGATFTLTFGAQAAQRVILTNQEFAILAYVADITDIDLMDPLFQDAWINITGARLGAALTGDKDLITMATKAANGMVEQARKADGNEGLTVNDRTPDWISVRGFDWLDQGLGMGTQFDWGPLFSVF